MQAKQPNLEPERNKTDDSLEEERAKTDEVLEELAPAVEHTANAVIEAVRAQADQATRVERSAADALVEGHGDLRVSVVELVEEARHRERKHTDAIVKEERRRVDVAVEQERAEFLAATERLAAERAETDAQLRTERAKTDEVVGRRDAFLAMVSHDLRNPLGVMAFKAQQIAKAMPDDAAGQKARRWAEDILDAGGQMERLIGDLLDVVALQSGKIKVTPERVEIGALLADGIATVTPARGDDTARILTEIPGIELHARLDRARALQILANLLGNALKFTPKGGAIVLRAEQRAGDVLFTVKDTGVGIAEADLPHVFDQFWQVRKKDGRGLGLGLYICKSLVEAHGGEMGVVSKLGSGTTFWFTMPVA